VYLPQKNEELPRFHRPTKKTSAVRMSLQKTTPKQDRMLPAQVASVLRIRDGLGNECPEDIIKRIDSLRIGKISYPYKSNVPNSSSNTSLNSMSGGNWRSQPRGFRSSNDGGGGRGWDRNMSIRRVGSDNSFVDESPRRFRSPQSTPTPAEGASPTSYPQGGRYVSAIVSDKKVEDRIIGHIRAKLNKFSQNNYDSVKSFLEQIMSSGETEFLSEFMILLFTKAASEENYCEMYARLLSELTERFPFLKTEITSIYDNFIPIFKEARDVPDQGTADYAKFLEAQQRKKYRFGYSQFLAEMYNKELLPYNAIEIVVSAIMDSLDSLEKDTNNTLLVEEYLASLYKIVTTLTCAKSAPVPPYIVNLVEKLKTIKGKPKGDTPGYTIKSRFKVMDIIDAIPN
jgi:hypothetical protein